MKAPLVWDLNDFVIARIGQNSQNDYHSIDLGRSVKRNAAVFGILVREASEPPCVSGRSENTATAAVSKLIERAASR
jgi:hypothetical protein